MKMKLKCLLRLLLMTDEGTIPQMAIDSGINTGKLIGYLQKKD